MQINLLTFTLFFVRQITLLFSTIPSHLSSVLSMVEAYPFVLTCGLVLIAIDALLCRGLLLNDIIRSLEFSFVVLCSTGLANL